MNLPAFAEEVGFLVQKGQVSWIVAPFVEVVRIKLGLSVWLEFLPISGYFWLSTFFGRFLTISSSSISKIKVELDGTPGRSDSR